MAYTTYQLHIDLSQSCTIEIGKLGEYRFPAGRYIYTGSAKRNFEARVSRHLRADKKLRWHIDYLLASSHVSVIEVVRSRLPECVLNQSVQGTILVKGFGASDCVAGCGSHLKYCRNADPPK